MLIAVTKPPVLPETDDGAKVRLKVPVVIAPPEVLDAVAVRAANTLDATIPAPPIAATATNEILSARLPALFESIIAIGFMSYFLPFPYICCSRCWLLFRYCLYFLFQLQVTPANFQSALGIAYCFVVLRCIDLCKLFLDLKL